MTEKKCPKLNVSKILMFKLSYKHKNKIKGLKHFWLFPSFEVNYEIQHLKKKMKGVEWLILLVPWVPIFQKQTKINKSWKEVTRGYTIFPPGPSPLHVGAVWHVAFSHNETDKPHEICYIRYSLHGVISTTILNKFLYLETRLKYLIIKCTAWL